MNKEQRARLKEINEELQKLLDEEQGAFDNMDEGEFLVCGDQMQENINNLQGAICAIEKVIYCPCK